MNSKTIQGNVILLVTAALWGAAFIFQKNATDYTDPLTFNAIRFAIGAIAILGLLLLPKRLLNAANGDSKSNEKPRFNGYAVGAVAGVFMFAGITFQQWGLTYTTVGKSGFITGLYIVMVPMLALFIGQRCGFEVWLGASLAAIGVFILNQVDDGLNKLNFGDFLTFLSAWCWALQILWLATQAKHCSVLQIVFTQMAVVALLSGLFAIVFYQLALIPEPQVLTTLLNNKLDFFYTGVVSTAVAFSLQIIGQQLISSANAALIMSLESFFALVSGIVFLNDPLTAALAIGCGFMFAGILIAQSKELRNKAKA